MTPERWAEVDRLVEAAIELEPDKRGAFLDQACGEDEALRREVESLLAAHERAESFIEKPPAEALAELFGAGAARIVPGETLGHYKIESLVGAGGMGQVYRAKDLRLDREVAVKVLPEHLVADGNALKRFEREAKAVAALSHPNILAIHDFGRERGINYAVMELLEGETLGGCLKRSGLPWRKAVEIGAAIAEGLAAAHEKGIIHRDLKPENIFLTTDRQVKILDFGLARVESEARPSGGDSSSTVINTTSPGLVLGTPGYMSPEQVRGEAVGAASDIFSLGCVIYEMVCGRRPFARETVAETMAAILRDEPVPLGESGGAVPVQLWQLVSRCLEKKARERFQSARDVAFDLRAMLSGAALPQYKPALWRRANRPLAWTVATLIILLAAILVSTYLLNRTTQRSEPGLAGSTVVIDSIAVLPLINASSDESVEYLSDGITESVINSLSQLREVRVMSWSAVSPFRDKEKYKAVDPREVGRRLKVRAVVVGRMIHQGDALTIEAELVDALDGSQLWGHQFKQKVSDLFSLQEDIARQISEKLRIRLTADQQRLFAKRHPESTKAYQAYLKGRHNLGKQNEAGFRKALEFFKQAIDLDPQYALAYAGEADAYYALSNLYLAPKVAMPKARAAATRALELDESLAEAHTSLAIVKSQYDWEWEEAEREYRRAIELNPSYPRAHHLYGILLTETGRHEEAAVELNRAKELDPLDTGIAVTSFYPYHYAPPSARQPDRVIKELREIIAAEPEFWSAHIMLGLAYEQKGMPGEAIAEFRIAEQMDKTAGILAFLGHAYALAGRRKEAEQVLDELDKRSGHGHVSALTRAIVYAGLRDTDQALAWLEQGYEARDEEIDLIKVDPIFDGLHSDPRFQSLLRRMNLAP